MLRDERLLDGDDFVEADVGVEGRLDITEGDDRTISTVSSDDKSNQPTLCVVWRKTYPNWPCAVSAGENATASWKVLSRWVSMANAACWPLYSQTERLVSNVVALAAVEHVGLDVVANGEQGAACGVRCSVYPVGAGNTSGNRT